MSAEDALKYGLIDEIVQPNDEKVIVIIVLFSLIIIIRLTLLSYFYK